VYLIDFIYIWSINLCIHQNLKSMKNINSFKLKEKHVRILKTLFDQLHLIIITIVLILYSVETASAAINDKGVREEKVAFGKGLFMESDI